MTTPSGSTATLRTGRCCKGCCGPTRRTRWTLTRSAPWSTTRGTSRGRASSASRLSAAPAVWYAESTPAIPNGHQRAPGATCNLGRRQPPRKGVLSLFPSCGPSLPEPTGRLTHRPPSLRRVLRAQVGATHGLDNVGCQTLVPQSSREPSKRSRRLGFHHGFLPGGHSPRLVRVRCPKGVAALVAPRDAKSLAPAAHGVWPHAPPKGDGD